MRCQQSKREWSSSRVFGGRYLVNQKYVNPCASYVCDMTCGFLHFRMVHAFACSRILPTQYINFCKFAGIEEELHLLWCVRRECSSLPCSHTVHIYNVQALFVCSVHEEAVHRCCESVYHTLYGSCSGGSEEAFQLQMMARYT